MGSYDCPGRYKPPAGMVEPPWLDRIRREYAAGGHTVPADWGTNYGSCSVCGKAVVLKVDGTVRSHVNSGTTVAAMDARRAKAANRQANAKQRMLNDLIKLRKGLNG